MKAMSMGYLESGRSNQKRRTRDDLLTAARRLIELGDTPRIDDVAQEAGISRTTAYRYFPTQADLLTAAFPETATTSLLPSPPPDSVEDRVDAVVSGILAVIERTESQQRAMLKLSLGGAPHELPLRQGRAIAWLEEALAPLGETLGTDAVRQLAVAIRSVCGIETRVWLTDVAKLDAGEVADLQLWAAQALVARAATVPPPSTGTTRR